MPISRSISSWEEISFNFTEFAVQNMYSRVHMQYKDLEDDQSVPQIQKKPELKYSINLTVPNQRRGKNTSISVVTKTTQLLAQEGDGPSLFYIHFNFLHTKSNLWISKVKHVTKRIAPQSTNNHISQPIIWSQDSEDTEHNVRHN